MSSAATSAAPSAAPASAADAPSFSNLVEMFERSVERYGPRELFGTKTAGGWSWSTYAEIGREVDAFRAGLAALGVATGDRVAIVSSNRVEWAVAAYATYGLGAALVPMYEAQLAKEWEFIAHDAGVKALIASSREIYEKVKDLPSRVPSLKHVIGLALPADDPASFRAVLERGRKSPVPAARPSPSDVACLIYTSGTTGNPKGVVLSHGNIASNISSIHRCMPIGRDDRTLSFLPWAHSFGHTCELHTMLSLGGSLGLAESVERIIDNLAEVRPTVLVAVPRIFNRIYDGVNKNVASKPALVRQIFHGGLRAAAKRRAGEPLGPLEALTLALADRLVFSKVKGRFGGRLKFAVSGGAALAREVAEFIDSLGITVYEGYGLSETSPIVTVNRPGACKIGSVGKAIPGVRVTIDTQATGDAQHGEVVVHGPNVMRGYHQRPEENAAVLTSDGGFRTGDMGYLDAEGFLYITGRIKEQYKLENGKYVVPSPLEEQLKLSPLIVNAFLYGENRPHNVALVVPDLAALRGRCAELGSPPADDAALVKDPRARELIQAELDKHSAEFKGYERIRAFSVLVEDFTTENDMLTPSLKLKRRNVLARYQAELDALYR